MNIQLTKEQANHITFSNIRDTLILMKQYLSREQIEHYQYMLKEFFGNLVELEEAQQRFDRAWPPDVKWHKQLSHSHESSSYKEEKTQEDS